MESELKYLNPERGVQLEVRTHYNNPNGFYIVLGVGFGGSARPKSSLHNLTKKLVEEGYKVRVFSPRNSGISTGHLTVDNYVSDFEFVINDMAEESLMNPFVMGHSIGGYALGKILSRENNVEKAVLLDPLLEIVEQNPKFLEKPLKAERKLTRNLVYYPFSFINFVLVLFGASDQRFSGVEDAYAFAESLYTASRCEEKMNIPTYIIFSGWTNFGTKIKNLEEISSVWSKLQCCGSGIGLYPESDYYFSGAWIKALGGRKFFLAPETKEIVKNIDDFFKS